MSDAAGATAPKKHDSVHTKAIATIQLAKGDPLSADQLLAYPPFADIPRGDPGEVPRRRRPSQIQEGGNHLP